MADSGAEVWTMAELPGHPNSVFTRDAAVCVGDGYLHLRMGLSSRRGEPDWLATRLSAEGMPCLARITTPGTLEGGDVLLLAKHVIIGISTRTNRAGAGQAAALFSRLGYRPHFIEVPEPYLHAGGCMSVLGPESLLVTEDVAPQLEAVDAESITVPVGDFITANVISLGDGRILAHRGDYVVSDLLARRGYSVRAVELGEFVKASGGPTCLIMPVSRW
ncbi:amidinotransferase [bacterium]|nr:amidinotransferase [candidate division CSSED10-310 bacterium]